MTIDPVNQPKKILSTSSSKNIIRKQIPKVSDSISISKDAKEKATIETYIQIVKKNDDVRQDKIDKVKKEMKNYFNEQGDIKEEILKEISNKITNHSL